MRVCLAGKRDNRKDCANDEASSYMCRRSDSNYTTKLKKKSKKSDSEKSMKSKEPI